MRRRDWPERLAAAIAAAGERTFSDDYYCAVFAADCVLAMTDEDPLLPYRGMLMPEALTAMHAAGHASLIECLASLFGDPAPIAFAQRGDVIVREDDDGKQAIGICMGQQTAFASDRGLTYEPTLRQRWCFRVR
jgi:hypothetical protein